MEAQIYLMKSIIRSPTAQIHDSSQRLLRFLQFLFCSHLGGGEGGGGRRHPGSLGVGLAVRFGSTLLDYP